MVTGVPTTALYHGEYGPPYKTAAPFALRVILGWIKARRAHSEIKAFSGYRVTRASTPKGTAAKS